MYDLFQTPLWHAYYCFSLVVAFLAAYNIKGKQTAAANFVASGIVALCFGWLLWWIFLYAWMVDQKLAPPVPRFWRKS